MKHWIACLSDSAEIICIQSTQVNVKHNMWKGHWFGHICLCHSRRMVVIHHRKELVKTHIWLRPATINQSKPTHNSCIDITLYMKDTLRSAHTTQRQEIAKRVRMQTHKSKLFQDIPASLYCVDQCCCQPKVQLHGCTWVWLPENNPWICVNDWAQS